MAVATSVETNSRQHFKKHAAHGVHRGDLSCASLGSDTKDRTAVARTDCCCADSQERSRNCKSGVRSRACGPLDPNAGRTGPHLQPGYAQTEIERYGALLESTASSKPVVFRTV